jgi:thiosulfate/3-mercaptopyruvate sulfurtransferase
VAGHAFGIPDMSENCTACHGSRVGEEYKGEREGYGADVHYVPNGMKCVDCHDRLELHGDGTTHEDRIASGNGPQCEDCHGSDAQINDYHQAHWGELSCQSCHSQNYKSCNSCHAGGGLAEPSYISFKIGKNPNPEHVSYKFVTLRHIPIAPDTYRGWGVANLANFSAAPTWKLTAPHNIRRWTERTTVPEGGTCSTACHQSPDGVEGIFLRQADLDVQSPAEAEANRDLIVPNGSPIDW